MRTSRIDRCEPRYAGTKFTNRGVTDLDMHHGTCVTHVPRWMPGSLTSGFLWSRWRGKRSPHSRRMRNPQFYESGKKPMGAKDKKPALLQIFVASNKRQTIIKTNDDIVKGCIYIYIHIYALLGLDDLMTIIKEIMPIETHGPAASPSTCMVIRGMPPYSSGSVYKLGILGYTQGGGHRSNAPGFNLKTPNVST